MLLTEQKKKKKKKRSFEIDSFDSLCNDATRIDARRSKR